MNSLLRKRTIKQILASRTTQRTKKTQKHRPHIHLQTAHQQKIEGLLKKNNLNNQDKITILRHIEKKYRIRFGTNFGLHLLSWVQEKEKKIVDKHYDSDKKSYFLLKGTLTLCRRTNINNQSEHTHHESYEHSHHEEVTKLTEGGIGKVFSPEQHHQHCLLIADSAILLSIDHPQHQLESIERNCLMTTEEKQIAVKQFPLFAHLDNVNKFYTPYFETQLFCKGEIIYNIGDQPEHLFLIVEGEVEFESKMVDNNPEIQGPEAAIASLTLRNSFTRYLTINTEIISNPSFFGQEQLLSLTPRKQTAKCSSLTCLLILVPLDKFHKLMFYNEFKDILVSAAKDRQLERQNIIASATALHFHKQQTTNIPERYQSAIQFNDLNKKIYSNHQEKPEPSSKLSLPDKKIKFLHGNPIHPGTRCRTKPETFSMLEVNKAQYESSLKKFRGFSLKDQFKKSLTQTTSNISEKPEQNESIDKCARNLKQIWQALKLQRILEEDKDRLPLDSRQGKIYYNSYMRRLKHLENVKSYRPKTINSTCRAKTQYIEYLKQIL